MDIYIIIVVFLCICTIKKRNIILYILSFCLLFIVGGLRGFEVGTDTQNYLALYATIKSIQYKSFLLLEPGWVILNLLCSGLFDEYRSVLIFSQILILILLFTRLWKSTSNPSMGVLFYVLLYYYLNSFNITRQLIATVIVFYGLYYLINKRNRYFYYCIFFATLFHYSSLFCLIIPLMYKIRRLSFSTTIFLLFFSYFCGIYVIPNILSFLPYIGRYMVYIERGGVASGSLSRIFLNLFFIVIYYYLHRNKYISFFFWGIVMYNLFAFSPAVGRIAVFFMISQLYIVSDMGHLKKKNRIQVKSLFLLYGFIQFFTLLSANVSEVVPYKFL